MDNSEIHSILLKLTDYDNLLNIHLLSTVIDINCNTKKDNSKTLQDIMNNTEVLEKKILNVENEVNKIKLSHNKNNEKYKLVNGERLKLAKKYVDLENEFSKLKSEIDEYDFLIKKFNEEIRAVNKPSFFQLYLELIKGFGVDFTKDRKYLCRVRNLKRECIVEVDLESKDPLYKTCNEIWNNM